MNNEWKVTPQNFVREGNERRCFIRKLIPDNFFKIKDNFHGTLEKPNEKKKSHSCWNSQEYPIQDTSCEETVSKLWYNWQHAIAGGINQFHLDKMSQYTDEIVSFLHEVFNVAFYNRRLSVLNSVGILSFLRMATNKVMGKHS